MEANVVGVVRALLLLGIAGFTGPAGAGKSSASSRPSSRSTTAPIAGDHIVIYKPGVAINWTRRQVELAGKVALREGMLELFACATDVYGGDKTHESIVLLSGRPLHVYQALGLIGLQPGRPARWDAKANKMFPATGQPLELRVEWLDDGRRRQVDVSEWMQLEEDPKKPLGPLPWVFAGSARTPGGGILADEDGTVATVVDFDGSIICLSIVHARDYDQLWVAARRDKVPQLDMPCTLIVRAAGLWLQMDRFGRITADGQRLGPEDVADAVRRYLKTHPRGQIHILVAPTALAVDVQRLRDRLRAAGASDKAVQIHRQPAATFPRDNPEAGRAFLRDQSSLVRSLFESAQREHRRAIDELAARQTGLERRLSAVADYVGRLRDGLAYLASDSVPPPATAPVDSLDDIGPEKPTTVPTSKSVQK